MNVKQIPLVAALALALGTLAPGCTQDTSSAASAASDATATAQADQAATSASDAAGAHDDDHHGHDTAHAAGVDFPVPEDRYANLAVGQHNNAVGNVQNALLVGNDDDGAPRACPKIAENLNQILEAPQVNAGLRLVKQGKLGPTGHAHGNFNAFHFPARKACIYLTVNIIIRTKPYCA